MRIRRKSLLALAALVLTSCADVTTVPQDLDPWDLGELGPSLAVLPSLPAVCGVATVTRLIAGRTVPVGTVEVTQGPDDLYVVYRTDEAWPLLKTAVFVGNSLSEMPLAGGRNPKLGHFPYKARHADNSFEVVWEIPLSSLSGPEVVVAAFAEVGETAEGAWGEGEMISERGNWSMYFTHDVTSCAAQPVDATGGEVSTPGGEASIQIPAGALTVMVDITIDPSTVQELLDHVPGAPAPMTDAAMVEGSVPSDTQDGSAAAIGDLPIYNGTVPLEGTVWNYGPDGLQFETPATITLSYDEAWIPEGFTENDLRIFIINGIFVTPASTVDPILNTVSAPIEHFSFAYIGVVPSEEADLSVISATESGDPILVGQTVTYQATLANGGPYLFPDVGVAYQAFGDVVAGTLAPGCLEVETPLFADVQIDCTIGTLSSEGEFVAPPAMFVAQGPGTVTVWMDPLSSNSSDPDLENNRLTEEVTVNAAELADLSVISATESADPILVGETVTYQATLENAGPYLFPDVGVAYQAFGDVAAGTLAPGCVEVETPLFADVQIDCAIGALSSVGQFEAPPAAFVAQGPGTVTVWMDPLSSNSSDPDLENNRLTEEVTVNAAEFADLSVISATESGDPILVGETVTYQATLENGGPYLFPNVGVAYQAFGNVTVGTLATGCVEVATPVFADVQIDCTIGTLASVGQFDAPPATFVAQGPGTVTVWMDPLSSNSTDPDVANNRLTEEVTVNASEFADLSVISATESGDPILVGESVTYQATIENFGPYLFPYVGVAYQAFGDVDVGTLAPGCVEVGSPLFADAQVDCTIGTLSSVGQFNAPPATFVARGTGTVTVWMDPFSSNSTDSNLANNRLTEEVTVDAAPNQLNFGEIILDQVPSGDTVWYSFEGVPGEFARVQVWVQEDANYSAQLVIRDPNGDEIYPDGLPRGRATDNSSAYHVFGMGDYLENNTWLVGLRPFGGGPYRIGLGTGAGRLDPTYSSGGVGVALGPNSNNANPFMDWEWVGDEIFVVGEEELVRFDANGEMDPSFGAGGVVDLSVLGAGRWGQALGVQPDGRIVVAARQTVSPNPWIIARFDAGGSLDPTFGVGGITEVPMGVGLDSTPLGVDFQQNGGDLDIVVGGDGGDRPARVGVVRLKPDGSVDTSFGAGGAVLEARFMNPTGTALQSDGSILIHDWTDLIRYTPDGVFDTSFGVDGVFETGIVGAAAGIDVLPDDRLLVTGIHLGDAVVQRVTADGTLDGTFAGGGSQTFDFGYGNERFQAVTPDGAGGLIAVGYQRTPGGDYEWLVSRMSFDGVLDTDFAIAGFLTENRVDNPRAVRIDSAGRIVVGGQAQNSSRGIEITRHLPN